MKSAKEVLKDIEENGNKMSVEFKKTNAGADFVEVRYRRYKSAEDKQGSLHYVLLTRAEAGWLRDKLF